MEVLEQAVVHGSAFQALQAKLFPASALLQWLSEREDLSRIRLQIAYKAVCKEIHPNQQYLGDGTQHFLEIQPRYIPLALHYGLSVDTLAKLPALPALTALAAYDATGINDRAVVMMITQRFPSCTADARIAAQVFQGSTDLTLIENFLAREFPHNHLDADTINEALVQADWFEKLRYNANLPALLLTRIQFLRCHAPEYYQGAVAPYLVAVWSRLYREKLLQQLSKEQLLEIDSLCPGVISPHVLKASDLTYRLSLLDNEVAGYLLGFPIQNFRPSDAQIENALDRLAILGIDDYAAMIKQYVATTYDVPGPWGAEPIAYPNEENLLCEAIDDYGPFDIVAVREGQHVYRFTRPEFKSLLEKRKNPYTDTELSIASRETIRSRYQAATDLQLPEGGTFVELLRQAIAGTQMTTSPAVEAPERSAPPVLFINDSAEFLALLRQLMS